LVERIGETLSGEGAPFFVSVFGPDLDVDDRVAADIAAVLQRLPQTGNVRLKTPPRQVQLRVALRPDRLVLYGLDASAVLRTVNAAFHGASVAELTRADRSVPVTVHIAGLRPTPRNVCDLLLRGRDGALVPLSAVATLELVSARSLIDHESGLRRQIVVVNPKTSDRKSTRLNSSHRTISYAVFCLKKKKKKTK